MCLVDKLQEISQDQPSIDDEYKHKFEGELILVSINIALYTEQIKLDRILWATENARYSW